MAIHKCVLCDYETKQSCNYSRHIKSVKHLKFVEKSKKIKQINNTISNDIPNKNLLDNKSNDEIVNEIVNIISNKLDIITSKMEDKIKDILYIIENTMKDRLDKIEKKLDNMEYNIIKEQRKTTTNLMTVLRFDKEYLEVTN
jgi:hypothetical protein